jgi:hypothetical protein
LREERKGKKEKGAAQQPMDKEGKERVARRRKKRGKGRV